MSRFKEDSGGRGPFARGRELPPGAITFSDMSWNRTGTWRYLKPRFVRRFSPCNEACPAGTDVEGFLVLAGEGHYEAALERILLENPFPGVCGRVCYHPCEAACNRNGLDAPVSIQGLERFVSASASAAPRAAHGPRAQRVAVVGAGPAGLTCAYHLARLGYRVTVFEREAALGGMLRLGIPAYRLPRSVLDSEIQRILSLGVRVKTECRVGQDLPWDELLSWDGVFLAVGAWRSTRLGIPGEETPGVLSGVGLLREVNAGRAVQLGGRVAVVGGGNTAVDSARVALRLGAEPVIVYRRGREEMPAIQDEVEEALEEGVAVEWLASPRSIQVRQGRVVGLECRRNRLGEPDAGGRRRPEPMAGSEFLLEVDAVLTAVGEVVEERDLPAGLIPGPGGVPVDAWGRTPLEGVWAGGDVGMDPRMVVHAIGAGKRAAMAIHAHLSGEDLEALHPRIRTGARGSFSMERYLRGDPPGAPVLPEVVRAEDLNLDHFEPAERVAMPRTPVVDRISGFGEVVMGYQEEDARREARRCFHCGACDLCGNCYWFCPDLSVALGEEPGFNRLDEVHCKGCGICAQECPRAAIIMEEQP